MRRTVTIAVPRNLMQISDSTWGPGAYLYALDRYTFGISGKPLREWQRISALTKKVPVTLEPKKMLLTVPRNFVNFYQLEWHRFIPAISSNLILVTIGEREDSHSGQAAPHRGRRTASE